MKYTFIGSKPGMWLGDRLPRDVEELWDETRFYAALRDLPWDTDMWLQAVATQWGFDVDNWTPIKLVEMLCEASADWLVGEEPNIIQSKDDQLAQGRLDHLLEENEFFALLHTLAKIAASEGGCYVSTYVDPTTPRGEDVPLFALHSQRSVIPHFRNMELVAGQIVDVFPYGNPEQPDYYRLFSTHTAGAVEHELFLGDSDNLGNPAPLNSIAETEMFPQRVNTGLNRPLLKYVPNRRNGTNPIGVPDVKGIEPLIFSLFESVAIGSRSFSASEARYAIDPRLVDPRTGRPPAGNNFYTLKGTGTATYGGDPLIERLQGDFDARSITPWQEQLFDFGLMLCGFSPQSIGRNTSGYAESGTAKMFAMAHTLLKIKGKQRYLRPVVKQLLADAKYLDSQKVGSKPSGGFAGFKWTEQMLKQHVSVEFNDGLPQDRMETAQAIGFNPESYSVERKVQLLNPDLKGDEYAQEVERVKEQQDLQRQLRNDRQQRITELPAPGDGTGSESV